MDGGWTDDSQGQITQRCHCQHDNNPCKQCQFYHFLCLFGCLIHIQFFLSLTFFPVGTAGGAADFVGAPEDTSQIKFLNSSII